MLSAVVSDNAPWRKEDYSTRYLLYESHRGEIAEDIGEPSLRATTARLASQRPEALTCIGVNTLVDAKSVIYKTDNLMKRLA